MNRKVPYDKGLIVVTLALLGFGLIMVFSTTSVASGDTEIFVRHVVFMAVGLTLMLLAMKVDYHFYGKPLVVFGLLGLTVALLVAALFSTPVKGVRRWVSVGGLGGQPSELAKLAMIFFTAYWAVSKADVLDSFKEGVLPYAVALGSVLSLVLLEPDFGTAACIALISVFVVYLGGLRHRWLAAGLLAAAPIFYWLVLQVPYRRDRILAFLNPDENPLGIGYQIRQSLIAVGSGGVQGLGLAQSRQKLAFLPEPHTDFVFAIVGEEQGLIGCTVLLALFLILFWKGVRIALRSDTPHGTLLGLGIVGMIVFQALINMSVTVSLLPTKGIPLPFISVGGSSMLVTLTGVGILLNISRNGRATGGEGWVTPHG